MGQKLPPKEMKLYLQTDEILHYMWDPIGVAGVAEARDEYYSYLPQIFQLVQAKKSTEEIAMFLVDIEENVMGLSPNRTGAIEIAEVLLKTRKAIIDDGF